MLPKTALIAGLLLVGSIAACSSDDEPTASESTTTEAPAESTDSTAPADSTETTTAAPSGEGETVNVEIGDFVFEPESIEIHVGDSVTWENVHTQAHTSTGQGDQDWNTGNVAPGDTSEPVLFDEAGSFTYVCALHPFMEGTVEVSA